MPEVVGRLDWYLNEDKDGHRDYTLKTLVRTESVLDGPQRVLGTIGLAPIGSFWAFGNDLDTAAYCWPNWKVAPVVVREPGYYWTVEQIFSTKPLRRCQDMSIDNPLLEPPDIGGSYAKFTKEIQRGRNGKAITSSSHELIKGRVVEFDDNRPTVDISMNVLSAPLELFNPMVDLVNDSPVWDVGPRCVKLSNVSWRRKLYGTCSFYYTVNYEFEINKLGFDRKAVDSGQLCLLGHSLHHRKDHPKMNPDSIDPTTGQANWKNPKNFEVFCDKKGQPRRCLLNGKGVPIVNTDSPHMLDVEYYEEANFYLLGIPASL
jgi:hypothetical protein